MKENEQGKAWRIFVICPPVGTKNEHKYVTSKAENGNGIADYNYKDTNKL